LAGCHRVVADVTCWLGQFWPPSYGLGADTEERATGASASRRTARPWPGQRRYGRELVDVPGRGPCARRAELVVEGAIAHGRRPAARSEHLSETTELSFIVHFRRLTFEDKVEALRGQRDRAVRILREVPGLAGAVA